MIPGATAITLRIRGLGHSWPLARDTVRSSIHIAASIAGTLRIGIVRDHRVAAAYTHEQLLGFPEHGPEIAVQNTVRTANSILRHSFPALPLDRLAHELASVSLSQAMA